MGEQRAFVACGGDPAQDVAALTALLPAGAHTAAPDGSRCAVELWDRWGGAALTGPSDGPPLVPQAPVAHRVVAAAAVLADRTAAWGARVSLDPADLLTGRAREAGFSRGGATSANGSCVLLRFDDGWVAVNLARPDDVATVAALLDCAPDGVRVALADALRRRGRELVELLQDLEVPTAELGSATDIAPVRVERYGAAAPVGTPFVLDLSAMWAGPLCASLLGRAGARVMKVEDPARRDGARSGPPAFYAGLHREQELASLRFADPADRRRLDELLEEATVVVESSRPRALRRLGIDAEAFASRPGRTWISITGYGREGDRANRVAFGDDAAVAGGLVVRDGAGPVFCADAVADPLTGLYAAMAGAASITAGGGHLVDVAMAGVCAHVNRPAVGAAPREHRFADGRYEHAAALC